MMLRDVMDVSSKNVDDDHRDGDAGGDDVGGGRRR